MFIFQAKNTIIHTYERVLEDVKKWMNYQNEDFGDEIFREIMQMDIWKKPFSVYHITIPLFLDK